MSYIYHHVKVVRVVDGDSLILEIDLGNKTTWRDSFRLMGINSPERGKPGYAEASAYLEKLIEPGLSRVVTHRPDKYGRYLADLYIDTDGGEWHVNRLLVQEGHALPYFGGKK